MLEKALLESRPDLVVDWCSEAMAWLTRRNDLLIASKAAGHNKDTKPAKNLEVSRFSTEYHIGRGRGCYPLPVATPKLFSLHCLFYNCEIVIRFLLFSNF